MKSKEKEKEIHEKNKQIAILNEILQMNSKQALSQESLIVQLKKQIQEEKNLGNLLLQKNLRLQENSENILLKYELLKKKYEDLKRKYTELNNKYSNILLTNLANNHHDTSILATSILYNSQEQNSPDIKEMPKKELKRTLSFKELNIKSEEKRKQPNSTRNHSAKDLNFPDLNQLIELSLKEESPKRIIQQNTHLSHFGKSKEPFNSSLDEISEKELPEHSSINTISETNKSNLNDISIEIKEIRKKPILHVFTQAPEANTLFFQNMNKNNDKKNTQYYEDLGSSVVALKYESFLSPFHQALQTDNHRRKSLNKRKEFSLKPIASLPGNHKEDILPINFLPLNSPHINSTTAKKFSKFFKKIDEVNEEENVSQIMINEKKKEIEVSKKSLFEEFFLIGLDKNEFIASNIDEGKVLDGFFPGKILYSFQGDGKTNEDCPRKRIIHEFAFPYGVPFKKLLINNSYGVINQIAFSYNPNEICKRAFIFTMRSDEYYMKANNEDPFLNILNPDRILYCICIIKKDYMETTKEDHIYARKNRKQRKFWVTKKIYCFVTYFPFVKLFIEILEDILNKIKFKRLEYYTMNRTEEHEVLKKIDISMISDIINSEIITFLEKIKKTPLPKYGENYQIEGLVREKIIYELPTTDLAEYEEAKWGAALAFSNLPLEDFLFIFFSILLEKKIVIVSKDIALLTGTIQTLFSLMRPFTWPHPLIFNLPESLFPLLDSPVPFLFGINQSSNFLFKHNINVEEKDKLMFICLDQERIFYSNKKLQKLLKLNPKFQEFRKNLGSLYNEFNKNGPFMTGKNLLLKNNERQNNKQNDPIKKFPSKNLIYNPNKEEEANCKKIFEIFRKTLEGISSNIIPKTPIFINNETKVLNLDKITEEMENHFQNTFDGIFLHKFYKTQMFAFWSEKYYEL